MNHAAMPAATVPCAGPDPIDYAHYRTAGGYRLLQACAAGRHDGARLRQRLAPPVATVQGARQLLVAVRPGAQDAGADRRLLEHDPHRFIEGLQLACWALELDGARVLLQPEHEACTDLLAHEIDVMRQELPVAGLPAIVLQTRMDAAPATLRCELRTVWRLRTQLEADVGEAEPALQAVFITGPVREPGLKHVLAGLALPTLVERHCGGMAGGERLYAAVVGLTAVVPALGPVAMPCNGDDGPLALHVLSDRAGAVPAVRELLARLPGAGARRDEGCRQVAAQIGALRSDPAWSPALLRAVAARLRGAPACACARVAADAIEGLLLHFRAEVQ